MKEVLPTLGNVKGQGSPLKALPDLCTAAFAYYPRLRRVQEHLDCHLSEKISLKTASGIAGLEEKYFSAFFHAKTGVSFTDWMTRVRIDRAMEMMRTREYTITNVALTVGYQHLRTFERAFKRCAGITPRAFKRMARPS